MFLAIVFFIYIIFSKPDRDIEDLRFLASVNDTYEISKRVKDSYYIFSVFVTGDPFLHGIGDRAVEQPTASHPESTE